jgi:hypothetical protein
MGAVSAVVVGGLVEAVERVVEKAVRPSRHWLVDTRSAKSFSRLDRTRHIRSRHPQQVVRAIASVRAL